MLWTRAPLVTITNGQDHTHSSDPAFTLPRLTMLPSGELSRTHCHDAHAQACRICAATSSPCPMKLAMVAPISFLHNHSTAVPRQPRPSRTRCHEHTSDPHLQGHGHKAMLSPCPMSTKPAPLERSVHGHDSWTHRTSTQLSHHGRDRPCMRTHLWSHDELSAGTPCTASTRAHTELPSPCYWATRARATHPIFAFFFSENPSNFQNS
jgi:hypothetical protein